MLPDPETRYGLFSLMKLSRFVSNLLDNFAMIYPRLARTARMSMTSSCRLEAGEGFPTVGSVLAAMSPQSSKGQGEPEMLHLTRYRTLYTMHHEPCTIQHVPYSIHQASSGCP